MIYPINIFLLNQAIYAERERRLVFGPRGSNFGGSLGDRSEVPQRGPGAQPTVGIWAEETVQIVHVRKIFCVSRVVSKRAY